jgi:hypothetical protein
MKSVAAIGGTAAAAVLVVLALSGAVGPFAANWDESVNGLPALSFAGAQASAQILPPAMAH